MYLKKNKKKKNNKEQTTVNPFYTDIRYNDKTRWNDNLNATNP